MKINFTRLFISSVCFVILSFITFTKAFATLSPPASCTAAIGSPANGTDHHITVNWSTVSGASSYKLESSPDNSTWYTILYAYGVTTYDDDPSSAGNTPVYYRVSAITPGDTTLPTNCTQFPIYTACDVPSLPSLSNAGSTSMSLQLVPESPTPNATGTTYSIYCTTTSQYVQSNGTLGSTQVFNTMPTWGTVNITGLSFSTNYCFYAAAKNHDGDIRVTSGGSSLVSQPFNSNVLVPDGSSAQWYIPPYGTYSDGGQTYAEGCADQSAAPGYPHWSWTGSAGCSANGAIYYQGDANWGYEECFVGSPIVNLSGKSSVTITFNLTNNNNYAGDYLEFNLYAGTSYSNGTFLNPSSLIVNGASASDPLYFTAARSCVPVTMTFNLSGTGYSNSYCQLQIASQANELSYSSVGYYALIDDINIGQAPPPTACLSTIGPLGISEAINAPASFSISPNPVRDKLTIQTSIEIKNARVVICNALGQEIYSENISGLSGGSKQIPLSVSPGIYFVQVIDETGKWVGKFVKE